MPLLKHDCRWRERMKLNQIRKLKKGVWCPVHILTMETSHKKFSSFTKVFKSAPLFSKQENCKCASSTASISRLYPCLWVFPNNHMVSKYCQLVISSSAHVIFVFEQCPKLSMTSMGNGQWATGCDLAHWKTLLKLLTSQSSDLDISIPFHPGLNVQNQWMKMNERGWKWMKMDESRWKWVNVDEIGWKWLKVDENICGATCISGAICFFQLEANP